MTTDNMLYLTTGLLVGIAVGYVVVPKIVFGINLLIAMTDDPGAHVEHDSKDH